MSTAAHSRTLFKLEEHAGEINPADIDTNVSLLDREISAELDELVLNENGSRFFLHWKLQTCDQSVLDHVKQQTITAKRRLTDMALEHKIPAIQSLLTELGIPLNPQQLTSLVDCHEQYFKAMVARRSKFRDALHI